MNLHPYHHARRTPDKPAYVMAGSGETVTYRLLEERSNQAAHLFRNLELKSGDHIALLMHNSPRLPEICFGAMRAGLIFTTMSTHLTPSEAEFITYDSGAKVLIASAALADVAKSVFDQVENCTHLFVVDEETTSVDAWEAQVCSLPKSPIADQSGGIDMLYSSGTTGRPKGIKTDYDGTSFDEPPRLVGLMQECYCMASDSIYLNTAPLYHAAPLRFSLGVMRLGGTVILMEKYDSEETLRLIEQYKVTHAQFVPTMFSRLLRLPDAVRERYDLSSVRCAIHAAAPCPKAVKMAMIDWWGPVLYEYYSGSEGSGHTVCNCEEWLENKGTVGRAVFGEIRILDEDGQVLPPGEENAGDIYFANAPIFEYHNDPEKTQASRTKEGWSTMGDVGYVNERGFLFLTDRKANMIVSGGVNIYPQEIENLLATHSKVADAAVFGVPNEEFGEEVKAVIQPEAWAEAGFALEQELILYCQENLSKLKCPRSIDFKEALPRHNNGKLIKRLLRDIYWEGSKNKLV